MTCTVKITSVAKSQIDNILSHLQNNLDSYQAMNSVALDIEQTIDRLKHIKDSLPVHAKFISHNVPYYIIKLKRHRYLIVYHFINDDVYIDGVFHGSQEYLKHFN